MEKVIMVDGKLKKVEAVEEKSDSGFSREAKIALCKMEMMTSMASLAKRYGMDIYIEATSSLVDDVKEMVEEGNSQQ